MVRDRLKAALLAIAALGLTAGLALWAAGAGRSFEGGLVGGRHFRELVTRTLCETLCCRMPDSGTGSWTLSGDHERRGTDVNWIATGALFPH